MSILDDKITQLTYRKAFIYKNKKKGKQNLIDFQRIKPNQDPCNLGSESKMAPRRNVSVVFMADKRVIPVEWMNANLARISFNRIHTSILQIGSRAKAWFRKIEHRKLRVPFLSWMRIRATRLIGSPGRVIKLARSVHLIPLCARVHSI